jgi:PAS domain S-box-containing protein
MLTSGKKSKELLSHELHRFIDAGKAGQYSVALNTEGMSDNDAEVIRLINTALSHFRRANDYLGMRYKLASDSLGVALWDLSVVNADYLNPDIRIVWSQEIRAMLGYEDETDFPDTLNVWLDSLHPDDKERATGAVAAHLNDHSGQTPYDIEFRIKKKDGDYIWVRAFGSTQRDGAGIPVRMAGGFRNIQNRKQMENQIKIMSSIVHNSPSFVAYKRINGECLYVNPSASAVTGYSHEELMEDYLGAVFGDKAEEIKREVIQALRKDGVVRYQRAGKRKDGEERIFASTSFMIEEDAFATIAADITETHRMEVQLKEANKRLMLMLDTTPMCVQIWDRNLKTIDCNEAGVKLYGFKDKAEYADRFLAECSPEFQPDGQRSDEKAVMLVKKAFEEGRCVFDWTHCIPADGSLIPAEITLVRAQYGDDDFVLGYTRDLRGFGDL